MKKRQLLYAVIVLAMIAGASVVAPADEAAFTLKPNERMRDVLLEYTGKRMVLRLASGEEIEGTITVVGNGLVQVSRLSGKEFYDAVVNIDSISAVRMRVRNK